MKHPGIPLRLLLAACLLNGSTWGCLADDQPVKPAEPDAAPIGDPLDLPAARAGGLHVMSWNIENFPRAGVDTIEAVVKILDRYRPDIVGLQEIADSDAFQELDDALVDYEGILNDDEGAEQRVGVLVRSERVTAHQVETLFVGDWYAFPRPPLRVDVTFHDQQGAWFDFSLISLHLKAMGDEDSVYRRRLACEKLEHWVSADLQREGADQDMIIVGDWNDQITDPAGQNVFSAMLDKPDRYRFLTSALEGTGAYSYVPYRSLIDHVMVTTDALGEYGQGATNVLPLDEVDAYYQHLVSDHRPVLSRFEIPPMKR